MAHLKKKKKEKEVCFCFDNDTRKEEKLCSKKKRKEKYVSDCSDNCTKHCISLYEPLLCNQLVEPVIDERLVRTERGNLENARLAVSSTHRVLCLFKTNILYHSPSQVRNICRKLQV